MADMPPPSSQDSHYEKYKIHPDQENISSSPPRPSGQKLRKPPNVTPKRFTKFFAPRSTHSILTRGQSKAGRQLRDITRHGVNRRRDGPAADDDFLAEVTDDDHNSRPAKRRKVSVDLASSPPRSSPLKHVQTSKQIAVFEDQPLSPTVSDLESLPDLLQELKPFPKAIRRLRETGPSRRILQSSFGGYDTLSRGWRGSDHGLDPRVDTANFHTTPIDLHPFRGSSLPFCTTSCNTNSLVAIGDEEGSIRLVDTSPASDFAQPHVKFRVHRNAIMDIAFSSDDFILATSSGDQSGRVIDMHSQKTLCVLSGHTASVKQIKFQPGDDNIITTSSKDGSVMLWDLRSGTKSAVYNLRTTNGARVDGDGKLEIPTRYHTSRLHVGYGHKSASRPFGGDSELSITSFRYLPHGREHLIVTASEVNASVKLWDLRTAFKRGDPIPLSSTALPEAHQRTRNYGINSMMLSGDGARLYTVCRDATIYAYSTNLLALGHVPEMSSSSWAKRATAPKAGLGPLYGFRHPSLRLGTFYIKAALRPARGNQSELLAVGSTDKCPILFPTDERYFQHHRARPSDEKDNDDDDPTALPTLPSRPSSSHRPASAAAPQTQNLPVFTHGTALVRAHNKEVTSLAWTPDGTLVSVSDDFTSRCWREDATRARALRGGGESGGQRWKCGWADVAADWDEVDC